ncbi:MAG TPA: GvpL/GvpF family gas vesicle protein [Gemmatimonadaceae bacterium]|nr:GvpL/GvpF family gas vesicle protein [Gemmatimonadaceae bacterium]
MTNAGSAGESIPMGASGRGMEVPRPEGSLDGRGTLADGGKYVYCIIRQSKAREFGNIGIGEGSNRVYTVHHKDLAAVVSDTPIVIYDPTRENVLAHEFVNETVMREFTVIPMSFGTVFRSEEDVSELLRSTYQAFNDVLDKMQDKIEFGLKVLWDRDKVIAEIERSNDEIRRLKDEISRNAQSSTYFARMQLGRLVEGAIEDMGNTFVADIHEQLKQVAVASRSNKPIGDRMILNAAFLVERDRDKAFDEKVKEISRKYEELLTFKYTGPWPPYNFVNIKLKLERAE